MIFVGWIVSYGFGSTSVVAVKNADNSQTASVADAPVTSLTATVVGAYNDLKSMIFGSSEKANPSNALEVSGGKR